MALKHRPVYISTVPSEHPASRAMSSKEAALPKHKIADPANAPVPTGNESEVAPPAEPEPEKSEVRSYWTVRVRVFSTWLLSRIPYLMMRVTRLLPPR